MSLSCPSRRLTYAATGTGAVGIAKASKDAPNVTELRRFSEGL